VYSAIIERSPWYRPAWLFGSGLIPRLSSRFVAVLPLILILSAVIVFGWFVLLIFLAVGAWYYLSLRGMAARDVAAAEPVADTAPDRGGVGTPKKVCVIGAGPAGLCTIKELMEKGHQVVCLEASDRIGGVFSRRSTRPTLKLTSSPHLTAFSAYPAPQDRHAHWTCAEYAVYLGQYAERFGLLPSIRLNSEVVSISRAGERFSVAYRHDGEDKVEDAIDHMAVCTGLHAEPIRPEFPGVEKFTGEIVHSGELNWSADGSLVSHSFIGKTVAVVGIGETAGDLTAVVIELGARSCLLSIRDKRAGAFILPRVNPGTGLNNDYDTNRLRYSLPKWLHNRASIACSWLTARFSRLDPEARVRSGLLLRSHVPPFQGYATKTDAFVPHLVSGKGRIVPEIASLGDGNRVTFSDGSVEQVDMILLCTGFKPKSLPMTDGDCRPITQKGHYLRMFDPEQGDRIGFIGTARPAIGSIPSAAEMQARYLALVVSGERRLPSESRMVEEIAAAQKALRADFGEDWGHRLTNWIPYMDQLAARIGCRPPLRLWLERPRTALNCVVGPGNAYQYRLHGPGARPEEAAEIIRSLPVAMQRGEIALFVALHFFGSFAALCSPGRAFNRDRVCSPY